MPPNPPDIAQLQKYAVNRSGEYEVIRGTLYDFTSYDPAGQTSLTFFQVPVGGLVGGAPKTLADTNMTASGQLPRPQKFLVHAVYLMFFPGTDPGQSLLTATPLVPATPPNNWNDVYALAKGGWLDFFIGSKSYIQEAPLAKFPPPVRLAGGFASTLQLQSTADPESVAEVMVDYATLSGKPFDITPIFLEENQNFNVTLNWPAKVPMPSNVAARIGVVLDGYRYRQSQ